MAGLWQLRIVGLLKLLAWGLGIYAGICLAVFLVQRRLMYFPDRYPYLPMGLILRDRWDSQGAIRGYAGPVAIVVAGRDEVVGASQGRRLAQACLGPVRVWEVPWAAHNEMPLVPGRPPWFEALAFLRDAAGMGQ